MRIIINEDQFSTLADKLELEAVKIISYLKSFGQKGKLQPFTGNLRDFYYKTDAAKQAYKWACESVDGVSRDGFVYFVRNFDVEVVGRFTLNKRGLIYVEREMDLDTSDDFEDLCFKSIGECWSWKRGSSSNYCSDHRFSLVRNQSVKKVVVCGYVHPDSIDWVETIYLNSYDMKNEHEIRMNDNAMVEVAYIFIQGKKYHIGGSFLLNASSDKYNKNREKW